MRTYKNLCFTVKAGNRMVIIYEKKIASHAISKGSLFCSFTVNKLLLKIFFLFILFS